MRILSIRLSRSPCIFTKGGYTSGMRRLAIIGAFLAFGSAGAASARTSESIDAVREEIKNSGSTDPWVGTFHGFGSIDIAPSGRYCATTQYCISPFESGDCGKLRLEENRYVAAGWWPRAKPANMHGPPYLRIAWGERHYLVPESEILGFVNDVNAAKEPRYGGGPAAMGGYLKGGEDEILVTGRPDLPEKYRVLLLDKPIMTTAVEMSSRTNIVTRIGDYEEEDCGAEARFDVGASSGVFVGMKLHAQSGDLQADVVVKEVSAGSCSGRVKQFDCDKSDPLPPGTKFASRPAWRINVSLSTEPLSTEIRFTSPKRFPPIAGNDSPEDFLIGDPFLGAAAEGFSWEEVAEVTFRGPFLGALRLKDVVARMDRTVLRIGGNAVVSSRAHESRLAEEAGGLETRSLRVFRLSYSGKPINPGTRFSVRLAPRRRGEELRNDWKRAALSAQAASCALFTVGGEAVRAALLERLHFDEPTLARGPDLRFEDLNDERRRAVEAFVPEERREGFVWPALFSADSKFATEIRRIGYDAERQFERDHPDDAAACRKLDDEANRFK